MAWVRCSKQKWKKIAFRFFGGRKDDLWQYQNYHIIWSIWSLVTVSYIKEVLHRINSNVLSLPFSINPISMKGWGEV